MRGLGSLSMEVHELVLPVVHLATDVTTVSGDGVNVGVVSGDGVNVTLVSGDGVLVSGDGMG